MSHLHRMWRAAASGQPRGRLQHIYLPADPHEAHAALVDLALGGRTARRHRAAVEATPYDHDRLTDVAENEGFSHHPVHGTPGPGYMVSHDDDGSGIAVVHHISKLTPEHIAEHRAASAHLLDNPATYQGGWHDTDDGNVYLDVSRHHEDEHQARDFAVQQRQKAYFNTHTFDTHYLSPKHDPLAAKDPEAWHAKYAGVGHDAPEGYESFAHKYPASEDLKAHWAAQGHHIATKGAYDGEPMGQWRSNRWVERELYGEF
jgi:hypothetical protein